MEKVEDFFLKTGARIIATFDGQRFSDIYTISLVYPDFEKNLGGDTDTPVKTLSEITDNTPNLKELESYYKYIISQIQGYVFSFGDVFVTHLGYDAYRENLLLEVYSVIDNKSDYREFTSLERGKSYITTRLKQHMEEVF